MHDAGTVVGGHVVSGQHGEGVRRGVVLEVWEWRQVAQTQQLLTGVGVQYGGLLAQFPRVRTDPGLRQQITVFGVFRFHHRVGHLGIHRDGEVGRQRPRRCGPDQQPRAVERRPPAVLVTRDPVADGDSRILTTLVHIVVHAQLVVGQRRLVTPAVRQHAVTLVSQTLVPQLFERPDDRFHEGQVQRLVVVVEVDPARLPGYVLTPFLGVAQHRLAAGVVELGNAHRIDLGLIGDAQLPFDLQLGGQSVGVPPESPIHLIAAHGLVSRDDVLDIAGQQMPVVR
ncbi:Uncharacterised protein [Mycobacteroides abscessus subsp. massiliense]|nr:Uncharacterised protein [Mycobacteroides abscessus subsp. massiliense]